MTRALTWWVGRIKVLEAEMATSRAAMRGSAPHWTARFMAKGIMSTVAPILEVTRVKNEVSPPKRTSRVKGVRMGAIQAARLSARKAAAPVFSKAAPRGMSPAKRKTVIQSTLR